MRTEALRFEPVNCVVTVVGDSIDDVEVMELVGPGSLTVRAAGRVTEHYPDIHGAMVYVGRGVLALQRTAAAIVVDLPDGRRRARGTALVKPGARGTVEASIAARTDAGEDIRLRILCRGAELPASALAHQ